MTTSVAGPYATTFRPPVVVPVDGVVDVSVPVDGVVDVSNDELLDVLLSLSELDTA